jgi:hypothetical protein
MDNPEIELVHKIGLNAFWKDAFNGFREIFIFSIFYLPNGTAISS